MFSFTFTKFEIQEVKEKRFFELFLPFIFKCQKLYLLLRVDT